jgi:arylsulfate sulfotransferase
MTLTKGCVVRFAWGLVLVAAAAPLNAAITVALTPSLTSPQLVGTMVTWAASVTTESSATVWYRFRTRAYGGDYRIVRDYGPANTLDWTVVEHEGTYEIEVSAQDKATGETDATSVMYEFASRVTDSGPVISATGHPLVFLYSAAGCDADGRMRIATRSPEGVEQQTPFKACQPGRSMNFYIAGLRPVTQYRVRQITDTGSDITTGPEMLFTTGAVPNDLVEQAVLQAPTKPAKEGLLLESTLFTKAVATDLSGSIVWFNPTDVSSITRPEAGGRFIGLIEGGNDLSAEGVREFDLVGMTIAETNVARVNEQLAAMGKRQVSAFHHEARRLPDGRLLVLGDVEQILKDVQGPGNVDVIGDMIIVLDANLRVVWTWDSFDHLDTSRMAVLGETCSNSGACAPHFLAADANDWTHGNSVQQTADGNLLYSSRHQDWLLKIDYENGEGSGDTIWKLGRDGDFQIDSQDPYPWFSHQHDANFESDDSAALMVFDDGNTHHSLDPSANSRGQVIQLDEAKRTAHVALNADLGVYSLALGSAQKLTNGDYHFDAGWVPDGGGSTGTSAYSVEVDGAGNTVFEMKTPTPLYRSFRMTDMYTPR